MINRQLHAIHPSHVAPTTDNDTMILADNLRIHPDIILGTGNGIFGSGVQGSGKTGILVRILEQAARFHVPMVVFDREGDLLSAVQLFPRGVIGAYQNCPTAKDIISGGLQVVYDLSTWQSMDDRGSFIASMVNSLYRVVDGLPVSHRTPCLIGLDEAALFLPQRRGEVFSVEVYKAMADAFHNVATTGRKRGLTPVLFTQKISEVLKICLSPGTYIMLKQVVHTDLKRYLDYIEHEDIFSYMTERQICQFVASLQPGRAIVKLANSEQRIVQFYERESIHTSHTPQVQAALNRYSALPFKPANFGAYIGDEDEDLPPAAVALDEKMSGVERVRRLLEQDPTMRVRDLSRQARVLESTASRARAKFFEDQP